MKDISLTEALERFEGGDPALFEEDAEFVHFFPIAETNHDYAARFFSHNRHHPLVAPIDCVIGVAGEFTLNLAANLNVPVLLIDNNVKQIEFNRDVRDMLIASSDRIAFMEAIENYDRFTLRVPNRGTMASIIARYLEHQDDYDSILCKDNLFFAIKNLAEQDDVATLPVNLVDSHGMASLAKILHDNGFNYPLINTSNVYSFVQDASNPNRKIHQPTFIENIAALTHGGMTGLIVDSSILPRNVYMYPAVIGTSSEILQAWQHPKIYDDEKGVLMDSLLLTPMQHGRESR